MSVAPDDALADRAGRAIRWSALTTAARFVLQLGAQVALARLLGPGAYGVYGLGIAVLTFAGFLAGTGLSYSLVLRSAIDEDDVRFAFTWQLLAGGACALAMALAAPALAGFFDAPALASTLRWMALACLLTAASGTALCLMQRALDFRALGLLQLGAYAAGYLGCGLPLALAGWGADALAIAAVAQAAATLAGAWWQRPHALRPLLRHAGGEQALRTGRIVFATNLVNWLLANLDRIVIGRVLHTQAVGLYTLAWNLAQVPVTLLVGAVQPALLSAGAQVSHEPGRLARAWHGVLACIAVLLLPAAVSLALLAPDMVRLLYGPAWAGSGWLLALLCLCLPAWAGWGLSTPVLWNTGRAVLEARLQWPLLGLAVAGWWLLSPHGLRWAAGVSALTIHARAAVTIAAGLRALGLRAASLLPLAARGLLLAAACGAATLAGQAVGGSMLPAAWPDAALAAASLVTGGLAALLTGVGLAWARPALLGEEALGALARMRPSRGHAAAPQGAHA